MHSRQIRIIKQYFFITLGSALLAVGICQFLLPLRLSSGGASAVGTIMLYLFGVPVSVTTLFINALLFFFGFKYLEKSSVLKTVVATVLSSLFLELCTYLPTYSDDMLISAVAGGIISGAGIGLTVREGASTGGSDFGAAIIHRLFPHISFAAAITVIDCTIVSISGLVFRTLTVTVYSMISLYLTGKTADFISIIGTKTKFAIIISRRHDKIAYEILEGFGRGATGIYSKGMYSEKDITTLLCALSPREIPRLIKMTRDIDPSAFIIIADSREVLGEGFGHSKSKAP